MNKQKLVVIVLSAMLLVGISYSVGSYQGSKKVTLGANMIYGNIGRYEGTSTVVSDGTGSALSTDNVGNLVISPSTTINIIGQ